MEPIKGANLAEIAAEAAEQELESQRRGVQTLVKEQLQRYEQLVRDIKQIKKNLANKVEKLKKAEDKISRLHAGDWSALRDDKQDDNSKEFG